MLITMFRKKNVCQVEIKRTKKGFFFTPGLRKMAVRACSLEQLFAQENLRPSRLWLLARTAISGLNDTNAESSHTTYGTYLNSLLKNVLWANVHLGDHKENWHFQCLCEK
jgi:hypothetical protein